MLSHALYLFLVLNTLPYTLTATSEAYTATDFILLDCGEPSNTTDRSNRRWDSDECSRYVPPNAANVSQSFPASNMHPSVVQVPYARARVFQYPFTYTFPVLTGPKFVRLYFYPDTYSTFNASQSFFSVTTNKAFTLFSNFSAYLNSPSLAQQPAFMKEFIINVNEENQMLNLTFSPSRDSFAFINGIEIVSIPDIVTEIRTECDTPHDRNLTINYTIDTPPYSAPEAVYRTSRTSSFIGNERLDWEFRVDSGFHYLLRFHFCEIQEMMKLNNRFFTIFINIESMGTQADVFHWTGGTGIPIYRDYVAFVPNY